MNAKRRSYGFTLVEMIMVIVVLSIAAVTILNAFATQGRGLINADEWLIAQNLAQECAEYIARSKKDGAVTYATVDTNVCLPLPDITGYSLTVNPVAVTSVDVAVCPSATADYCKDTTITVTKNGVTLSQAKLLVVKY